MEQYINKSAIVAEIERRKKAIVDNNGNLGFKDCQKAFNEIDELKKFINTLEVKEVDLDFQTFAKEMGSIFALPSYETKNTEEEPLNWEYAIAKHFFELGMSVNNKAQKGEKIRAEIERLMNELIQEKEKGFGSDIDNACILELQNVLTFIDSLQEEPVKIKKECKYRCLSDMLNKDTGNISFIRDKIYLAPLNGWLCDTSENASNFELVKEPVSEDLEEAINAYIGYAPEVDECSSVYGKRQAFKAGAEWKEKEMQSTIELVEDHAMLAGMEKMKEQMMANIWKPADGDDLPEIDREVIVLTQHYPLEGNEYVVSFAHRPNPDGWDGKSIATGKVEHYIPKTYDKGGWNIPDVKYWLDCLMPKEIEL